MKKKKQAIQSAGEILAGLLKADRREGEKPGLQQELLTLSGGNKEAVKNYYIHKIKVLLCILLAGIVLAGISWLSSRSEADGTNMQTLERPGYGEGDRKEELSVQVEGAETPEIMEVTVQERKYTDQEKQELLNRALEELEKLLPGENESTDQVRSALVFPKTLQQGAVRVSWMTIPYGIIDDDGTILSAEDEKGTLVEVQAVLTCGERESVYTSYVKVVPSEVSEEEQFRRSLQKEVELADVRDRNEEKLKLPETSGGKKLTWNKQSENPGGSVLALFLVIAVCVYVQMDNEVHQKAELRKTQLLLDYPDLMWKMTMLLGAGLSIKGTFTRISEEYHRKTESQAKKQGMKRRGMKRHGMQVAGKSVGIRYVYEEISCTCYEMQSGIPEAQAYERFGKRCQLPEYIRIGSVLSQNLKKGAKGLTALLESEAESSLNDRKNHARKIGEQAGTKLLLPMVLMLGVVLAILMIPAFLSF